MADRVQYLPMELVSLLPHRFKHLSIEDVERITDLLTTAYGYGYHDGFVRGGAEEHGKHYLSEQKQKAAVALADSTQEETEGGAGRG